MLTFLIANATQPYTGIFEQALREAGKPAAYAIIAVGLALVLLRGGIVPALKAREEARVARSNTHEAERNAAHRREMEIEEVRAKRDQFGAEQAAAAKDGLQQVARIHESTASLAIILERMMQSMFRERERSNRNIRKESDGS